MKLNPSVRSILNYDGEDATILRNKLLVASGGSYTYTGQQVNITVGVVSLYPNPAYVLEGVTYGPGGIYTGTLDPNGIRLDLTTGNLFKPLSTKVGILL